MIFKNRAFARFAAQHGITDENLCDAVDQVESGLIDANLGGGVLKEQERRLH